MKKISIDIPKGYEIDVEASDFANSEIALKPIQKKWKDLRETEHWFFDVSGNPFLSCDSHLLYRDAYPTKELLLASEALRQLLFWRNEVWKEDNNWKPTYEDNKWEYDIIVHKNEITKTTKIYRNSILSFRTEEIRNQFLKDHIDLIEQAKPLL